MCHLANLSLAGFRVTAEQSDFPKLAVNVYYTQQTRPLHCGAGPLASPSPDNNLGFFQRYGALCHDSVFAEALAYVLILCRPDSMFKASFEDTVQHLMPGLF